MEELARTAGVSVRTLYRVFGSRHALLQELGRGPAPTARELILEAGLELVGRHGLAELSMDDLAAAAGVSRATLYRLFPGRSALFAGLMRAYAPWDAVADAIEAMPDGRPEEVAHAVSGAVVGAMEERVGLLLLMVFELLKGGPDTAEGMRQEMERGLPDVIRYLAGQMAAGRLRRCIPSWRSSCWPARSWPTRSPRRWPSPRTASRRCPPMRWTRSSRPGCGRWPRRARPRAEPIVRGSGRALSAFLTSL